MSVKGDRKNKILTLLFDSPAEAMSSWEFQSRKALFYACVKCRHKKHVIYPSPGKRQAVSKKWQKKGKASQKVCVSWLRGRACIPKKKQYSITQITLHNFAVALGSMAMA